VAFQYLTFFLEDDAELEEIRVAYRTGKMLTGELKARCISELQTYVLGYQDRRSKVTEEIIDGFMALRPLEWKGNPKAVKAQVAAVKGEPSAEVEAGETKLTKNQEKKLKKEREIAEKKAKVAKEKEKAAVDAAAPASAT
jgi:tryptophanyl-tRNA synthetase